MPDNIVANIQLKNVPVLIKPKRDYWLAYCPMVDIMTQAETKKQVKENIKEAIMIFFEETIRHNTFFAALHEIGWKKQPPSKIPTQFRDVEPQSLRMNVPIPELLAQYGKAASACRG